MVKAYTFWWLSSILSIHRFYCGDNLGGCAQLGLVIGSFVISQFHLAASQIGIAIWFLWLILDLALIPRLMRRCRDNAAFVDAEVFE